MGVGGAFRQCRGGGSTTYRGGREEDMGGERGGAWVGLNYGAGGGG